jgi:predicted ThiF/HesA family dinucleotide-utilizing enzyme
MDTGPEVYERPPKIYGTNQVFNASRRRSPETFSPVGTYRFGSENQSTVTIRDRRAPNNPYLLEQQMRNAAKSDYNY